MTSVLQARDLFAGYAGQAVLHRVALTLDGGELVSLLGANGAGKSTLLKTVVGTVPVIRGQLVFNGVDITAWSPHKRIAAGIGFSPEGRRIFANLSLEENLKIGATPLAPARRSEQIEFVCDLFPILRDRMSQRAGTLSGGEQQMLAVARAMMTRPKLLMVEEPSQGLAPIVVDRIYASLRQIANDTGVAVLVAEQFQQVREDASDRILVIDKGEVVPDETLDVADSGSQSVS